MDLHRLQVKFYFADPQAITPEEAFRIFNTWIPQAQGETLVDVADYSHVPDGPVTLLVGHEANYSIDNTDRRLGLLYVRKQPLDGSLAARLQQILAAALRACCRLEQEPDLAGRARFSGRELLLVANDRLHAPNTAATHQALAPHLDAVLARLYRGAALKSTRDPDPAQRFNLRVEAGADFELSELLRNLEGTA